MKLCIDWIALLIALGIVAVVFAVVGWLTWKYSDRRKEHDRH